MAPTAFDERVCGAKLKESDERTAQEKYWKEHTAELTVEAMMLDSQAAKLNKEDRPEVNDMDFSPILSTIPSVAGKRVIELGAGIGRFTGELAQDASHVLAMDFMQNSIEKNKEVNGHYGNVDFLCADVTSTDLDKHIRPGDTDLVFSNWLLMYLSDNEVQALVSKVITWLKPGGHFFFRESCFHQSGDMKRANNPTHYRGTNFYQKVVEDCYEDSDGSYFRFNLVCSKCVGAYVRNKRNQNQICWLWEKVPRDGPQEQSFQQFLDSVQYTNTGILRYERVFGEGYVSTGGLKTTKEFVKKLELKAGEKVLDVGCGIGGGDFYMAAEYGAEVSGIDLSVNMISLALERAIGHQFACQFEVADCTKREFPKESFDAVYSRDVLLHIEDKVALLGKFYKWLKPGGRLLITDYCKSAEDTSDNFEAYIKQRGYFLHDVQAYGKMLRSVGFVDVVAEDRTQQFVEILSAELDVTRTNKEQFINDFSENDYNCIVDGWEAKLQRCARGEQKWGLFIGVKR